MTTPAPKICASCGRRFEWRKRWQRNWSQVRYCSAACRKARVSKRDRALEEAMLSLFERRGAGATICPSEVARHAGGEDWRELMEPVRRAARRLAAIGKVRFLQRGREVDPSTAKGAIRLARKAG